ncbi:UNVERIFIED_CONTAM: hypothetical protein Sradi_1315700 [Sesamum radiatum]|uniref:Uncharacterized protein n=1 Tax=Sesamum radiatum TaxID=300843 RepID=A0AAW2UQ32_SESRA
MRNSYSLPGFPWKFCRWYGFFNQSRKRKPVSTGWCRYVRSTVKRLKVLICTHKPGSTKRWPWIWSKLSSCRTTRSRGNTVPLYVP